MKTKNRKFRKEISSLIVIVLLIFLITVPFINKAFHIDDIYVIEVTRQLVEKPLDPYGFQLDSLNKKTRALVYTDPPIIPYYASLLVRYFGEKEIIIHLGFIIFPLLAGISMFYLSKRFTSFPLYSSILMIISPTFVVHSHTIMQDIPVLALMLFAILFHIKGVDEDNPKYLILASIAAGIAFLIKYNAIILFFLIILYSVMNMKFKSLRYMIITFFIVLVFFLHNLYFYGTVHLLNSLIPWLFGGKGITAGIVPWLHTTGVLFISNLNYIGGAILFSPFLIWPFIKKKEKLLGLILISLISLILSVILYIVSKNFVSGQYTFIQLSLFFTFVTSGLFIIYNFLADNYSLINKFFRSIISLKMRALNKTERNIIFLLIWFIVVFIFNFTLAGGSVRYNTLLLPPFVLLFMPLLSNHLSKRKLHITFGIIFITTLILSLGIAFADYQYAETYRQIPKNIEKYNENEIFFLGHEGFKYYMELNGAVFLTSYEGKVKKGNIIVKAPLASPHRLNQSILENIALNNTIEFNTGFPIRVLNSESHAGFYKFGAGFLPFSISNAPLEKFEIYIVQKEFEK